VPPKVEGICDKCGGKLVQREDDKEDAINKRLAIFNNETIPVIEHFKKLKTLVEVDASNSPQQVFSDALKALNIKHDQY
jgi:adenylate kinase